MTAEPCLCGADDCPRCFPERNRRRRPYYNEDAADAQRERDVAREVNQPEPQGRTPYCQEDE